MASYIHCILNTIYYWYYIICNAGIKIKTYILFCAAPEFSQALNPIMQLHLAKDLPCPHYQIMKTKSWYNSFVLFSVTTFNTYIYNNNSAANKFQGFSSHIGP